MATSQKNKDTTVYQIKISLKSIRPPIWRRVQVLSSTTLAELHRIIQYSMGWFNCHLHQFDIDRHEYGQPAPEYDFYVEDETKFKLSQVIKGEKFKFFYTYDFGDDWRHEILIEKILARDPDVNYPICIKGKRACPPEDCGGPFGYPDFLEAIQDSSHPEHENMLEWIGDDFDPEAFDLAEANELLARRYREES
ncbi:MAG: plasmid pRiA4b ORF-3 family protein [Snowella sp.]|nr:plasmid pRiA4b ORF-3 family protein [Snowella sp.]